MRFSSFTLLLVGLVGLTACGGEPEPVLMDRRFLTAEQLDEQADALRAAATGEVLDAFQWTDGAHRVLTLLARERGADGFEGVFLRHYQLADAGPQLLWTYQDTIACQGADAGAKLVADRSPALRPGAFTAANHREFVLRYHLDCSSAEANATNRTLVVINVASGTPTLRFEGQAEQLAGLPADRAQRLRTIWEG